MEREFERVRIANWVESVSGSGLAEPYVGPHDEYAVLVEIRSDGLVYAVARRKRGCSEEFRWTDLVGAGSGVLLRCWSAGLAR